VTIDLRTSTDFEVLRAARVLARIDEAAREAQVDYLVVGATARSLISIDLLGTSPQRRTRDIDIAAQVESWDEFHSLVRTLGQHGRSVHKFIVEGTEVDVVPYGGIEQADRTIMWPDDHAMNVLGFREAVDSAQTVLLPDGISVKVPSIPALALLKLFAWRDRHHHDTRDAVDLGTIVEWYSSGSTSIGFTTRTSTRSKSSTSTPRLQERGFWGRTYQFCSMTWASPSCSAFWMTKSSWGGW